MKIVKFDSVGDRETVDLSKQKAPTAMKLRNDSYIAQIVTKRGTVMMENLMHSEFQ